MDDKYEIPNYFGAHEFRCQCGNCDLGFDDMDDTMIEMLNKARHIADFPFVMTSAIRCLAHNKDVGGSVTSSHLDGMAVDIHAGNSRTKWMIMTSLILVGFKRLGIGSTFIHVDLDNRKTPQVLWTY